MRWETCGSGSKVCARGNRPTGLCGNHVSEPSRIFPRSATMAENGERSPVIAVQYDAQADILTFAFAESPQPGVAEEAADEVWVRYDPQTRRVITVDVLNFSARVREAFGSALTYTERTDPQRLDALRGLPLPTKEGDT